MINEMVKSKKMNLFNFIVFFIYVKSGIRC
jgi:hypothetical protein